VGNALRVKYKNRNAYLTVELAHVLGRSSQREELVAGRRLWQEARPLNAENYWNSVIVARPPMNCCANSSKKSIWKKRGSSSRNREKSEARASLLSFLGRQKSLIGTTENSLLSFAVHRFL